ncbi:uncharacterized protein LOC142319375 [Lycorma delicatula]|uniref:uncharacterized protein LOC142319375 n=1 Tax=Lycorma delicatula TaxID=130591 RepID=UPI003F511348
MLTMQFMLRNHILLIILFGICSAAEESNNNVLKKKLLFKDGTYPHLLNNHQQLSIHHPSQETSHVKDLSNIDLIKQNSKEGHSWPNTLSSVSRSRKHKNFIHNENQFYGTSKKIKRSTFDNEEESKQVLLFDPVKPPLEKTEFDDDVTEKSRGSLFKPVFHCFLLLSMIIIFI